MCGSPELLTAQNIFRARRGGVVVKSCKWGRGPILLDSAFKKFWNAQPAIRTAGKAIFPAEITLFSQKLPPTVMLTADGIPRYWKSLARSSPGRNEVQQIQNIWF